MNDVPVARQSRDPARPQAGESLLDAKHECSPAKPNAARWKMQPEVARPQAGESLLEAKRMQPRKT